MYYQINSGHILNALGILFERRQGFRESLFYSLLGACYIWLCLDTSLINVSKVFFLISVLCGVPRMGKIFELRRSTLLRRRLLSCTEKKGFKGGSGLFILFSRYLNVDAPYSLKLYEFHWKFTTHRRRKGVHRFAEFFFFASNSEWRKNPRKNSSVPVKQGNIFTF